MSTLETRPIPLSRPALPPGRGRRRVPLAWWPVAALSLLVVAYGTAYVVLGERMYPPNLRESFLARPWGIYTHALFGSIGMLTGPPQFLASLRARRPGLHRAMGKVYVGSAMMVGLSGLYMAPYSFGGMVTHLGFGGLAAALLVTTGVALARIRGGDVEGHRAWMVRSFALLFGAATLRIEIPLLMVLHQGDFLATYREVAWLSWVPNLLWAEAWLRFRRRPALAAPAAA